LTGPIQNWPFQPLYLLADARLIVFLVDVAPAQAESCPDPGARCSTGPAW
jgi:hypothetical protein